MIRIDLISLFFLLFFFTSFSQIKNIEDFDHKVYDYFALDYETFFTHPNKTKFFKGEELWFKTYIYDIKRHLPYNSSTNIYSSIYNKNGELIKKKIYAAESGMTYGNFKIDSTYSPGIYYLKTSTNWMLNFHDDLSHIQKFEIVGSNESNYNNYQTNTYDFQLLPEGGYIIEDAINTVGFKINNNIGKAVKILSGKIIDSDNKIIAMFRSNRFGHGKFIFKPEKGKLYFTEILLESNDTLTNPILNIQNIGINLNVENSAEENLIIRLNTNNNTLTNIKNKQYYLVIHRDGLVSKIDVNFNENIPSYQFTIERKLLNSGINIVTLFDDKFKPVCERIVYNFKDSPIKEIEVSKITKERDSTVVELKSNHILKGVNLSVSILPSSTIANTADHNIISKFLLSPYIKGSIENPWYYFDKTDREKLYDLDLLLLTQGWGKYSWVNIFDNPPKISHNFETGFVIKGEVQNYIYKNGDKLLLQSKENGIQVEYNLDENKFFQFDKLYLKDETSLNFSLKNKNEKLSMPSIYFNIYPSHKKDFISVEKSDTEQKIKNINNNAFIFDEAITVLDSIEINSISINTPKPKNTPYGVSNARHISFKDEKNINSLITQQIRNYGFDVTNNNINVKIVSRRASNLRGSLSPLVFLDNVNITQSLDLISNLMVSDVEEMFVSTSSNIYASAGGVIHIFTKTGVNSKLYASNYNNSEINFGFSVGKKYYSPLYNKFENEIFNNLGVLNWLPNLKQDENGRLLFKIPNYFYDSINLYIEGMAEDGSLFSKIETISIN